jgi:hypothetical protein
MAVLVGSARSDENGKAYGGKAGDQKSGKEVSTQSWYEHSKGWRVFRANDPKVAAKIASIMRWACETSLIGYDQWNRHTLYDELKRYAFEKTYLSKPVETDSSALVRVCLAFCGIDVPEDFRTGNMPTYLLNTGAFVELKGAKYTQRDNYLGAGDILVTKTSGHTVVCLSNGQYYEGGVAPKEYTLGERILRKGDEGADVKLMQEYLEKLGYDPGGNDGDFGPKTLNALKAFQEEHGLTADGEYGPKSHAALMAAVDRLNDVPVVEPGHIGNLKVLKGSWNVRTDPGTAYATKGIVHGGDVLSEVTPEGWIPVVYDGEVGWISRKAIEGM